MQIAAEVHKVLHKRPGSVKMAKFKLKFETNTVPSKTAMEISRRRWLAFVGLKVPDDSRPGADDDLDNEDINKEELLTKYQSREQGNRAYQRALERQQKEPTRGNTSPRSQDGGDLD